MTGFRGILAAGLGILIAGFSTSGCGTSTAAPSDTIVVRTDTTIRISLAAVGDLMCHSTQFNYARVGEDTFNFRPCYQFVGSSLKDADFTMGNLETALAGNKYKYIGFPLFNSPDDYLDPLADLDFDLILHANNHTMDRGEAGVIRTNKQMDLRGLAHSGSFISQRDRDSIRIFDIQGLKMGVVNFTYGTNDIPVPSGKEWLVNVIDTILIAKDIAVARKAGASIVTVFFHWGEEGQRMPNVYQQMIADATIRAGADLIIGAHPHVLQPISKYKTAPGATLDSGIVAWSLGNFFSNQPWRYNDAGTILYINLDYHYGDTTWVKLAGIEVLPTWVYRGTHPEKKLHLIFPSEWATMGFSQPYLNEESMRMMKEAWEDSKLTLTKMDPGVKFRRVPLPK